MLERPILRGQTILLRPITVEDSAALFDSLSDKESMRLTGTHQTFTLGQVQAFYGSVGQADDRVDYAIVPTEIGPFAPEPFATGTSAPEPSTPEPNKTNPAVGEVVLNQIDWHSRTASFRIALFAEKYFGKGYGSQATQLMLQYGFEQLDLHRIELEVFDFNPRALHVYKKAGFVQEGVKRDVLYWEGIYHSAIVMSILKPEYVKRNAK